jgi:hypothetical protein
LTIYCKAHPQFEGVDLGKIHDHIAKDHKNDFEGVADLKQYAQRVRKIFEEQFFEVAGPSRLGDHEWIARTWGRPPKLASEVADSDLDRKR